MRFLLSLLLFSMTACGGFSEVTLKADPPLYITQLGEQRIDEVTPLVFRPDDYLGEKQQDLRLTVRRETDSGSVGPSEDYRWRIWYSYGGSLDQVQLPKVRPEGDLWLHRGKSNILFVQADKTHALLVENAWINRLRIPSTPIGAEGATGSEDAKGTTTLLNYHRVSPGSQKLETKNWRLQVDLPAGVTLLYEEGAGLGKYVHVAFPKIPDASQGQPQIRATHGGAGPTIDPVPTRFLSMGRILEEDLFTENYYAYAQDKDLHVRIDLSGGRKLSIRCRPKNQAAPRPPLILCLCPGS